MSAKKKQDSPEKIVVELDVVDHLTKRIDHYLFKKWPDIFIEENFQEFKRDLSYKQDQIVGTEDRMRARMLEAENRIHQVERDTRSFVIRHSQEIREIAKDLENIIIKKILSRKKWWELWKKKK